MYGYVVSVRGGSMHEARVELAYPPPFDPAIYARWFDCEVRFDCACSALVIPAAWREARNPDYDETSFRTALARCELERGGAATDDPVNRVRQLMAEPDVGAARTGGHQTLEQVAARMHVSSRTLIRTLRQAGTTFQALVDEFNRERARMLLADRDRRIHEVAAALGFTDPASFGRSFKRWFGVTPGTYRKQQAARDSGDPERES